MKLSDHDKKSVVIKYNEGAPTTKLAKEYMVSPQAISGILKRRNVKIRSASERQMKYDVNTSFFDSINTEGKAYFLGILYADGYHYEKRNSIILQLKYTDAEILYKLKELVGSNRPLKFIDRSNDTKPASSAYRLTLQNQRLSESLRKCGCTQGKTYTIRYPEWLRSNLHRHFIRGYFDGDGCIRNRGSRSAFSIIGNRKFIVELQKILIKRCNLTKTKLGVRFKMTKTPFL